MDDIAGDDLYERLPAVVVCSAEIWPDREVKPKEQTISRADPSLTGQTEFKKAPCLSCYAQYWAALHEAPAVAAPG